MIFVWSNGNILYGLILDNDNKKLNGEIEELKSENKKLKEEINNLKYDFQKDIKLLKDNVNAINQSTIMKEDEKNFIFTEIENKMNKRIKKMDTYSSLTLKIESSNNINEVNKSESETIVNKNSEINNTQSSTEKKRRKKKTIRIKDGDEEEEEPNETSSKSHPLILPKDILNDFKMLNEKFSKNMEN